MSNHTKIVLREVKKSFLQGGKSLEILRGVNAEIHEGENIAIVGQSGSGKSTLLALLAGLDFPDSGEIICFGTDFATLSEAEVRKTRADHIGVVFQQFHLLPHLSAMENVHLPLELRGENNPNAARSLLEELGLGDRAHHFPAQLSGGECQRVAIARALITNPKLILADEPSGNLDPQTGDRFMDLFFRTVRARKTTSVLVTHNSALADRCDRKLRLDLGRLVNE